MGNGLGRPSGKLARPDIFHPRIVLAGSAARVEGDRDAQGDDAGLVGALRGRGLHARWLAWDDPQTRHADLVILRATADYAERLAEFLAWTTAVAHLLNAPNVVAWNADRGYLLDLAGRGVPTVPTAVLAPGEAVRLAPSAEVVVKPSVGAGARRFTDRAGALAYVGDLHRQGRAAVVQGFDGRAQLDGQTALVFLGGRPSHAFTEFQRPAQVDPDFELWDVGAQALAAAAASLGIDVGELLYARAGIVGGHADPRLVELELVDPSLGWRRLDAETLGRQQREFTLCVESALERLGLGPFSHRRP